MSGDENAAGAGVTRRRHPGWMEALQLFLTAMLAWLLLIGVVWLAIEAVAR